MRSLPRSSQWSSHVLVEHARSRSSSPTLSNSSSPHTPLTSSALPPSLIQTPIKSQAGPSNAPGVIADKTHAARVAKTITTAKVNKLRARFEPPPSVGPELTGAPGALPFEAEARAGVQTVGSFVRKAERPGGLNATYTDEYERRNHTKTAIAADMSSSWSSSSSTWTAGSLASSPPSSVSSPPSSDSGGTSHRVVSRPAAKSISPDPAPPTKSASALPTKTALKAPTKSASAAPAKTVVKAPTKSASAAPAKTALKAPTKPAPAPPTIIAQPKPAPTRPTTSKGAPASMVNETTAASRARAVKLAPAAGAEGWMRPGLSAVTRKRLQARLA